MNKSRRKTARLNKPIAPRTKSSYQMEKEMTAIRHRAYLECMELAKKRKVNYID